MIRDKHIDCKLAVPKVAKTKKTKKTTLLSGSNNGVTEDSKVSNKNASPTSVSYNKN